MTPIDFDEKFKKHLHAWAHENLTGEENEDEIEEKELAEYESWTGTPQDWLDGRTPKEYFDGIADANTAIKLFAQYAMGGIGIPPLLITRMIEMKEEVYPALLFVLRSEDVENAPTRKLKAKIIELITEMEKPHPYDLYIRWITESKKENELTEEAAYALLEAGEGQKEPLLEACRNTGSGYAGECLMDILSNFLGDGRIVEFTVDRFLTTPDRRAFYANCLGKLGDPEALQYLYEALADEDLGYYDYTAIKYAIEELGGIVELDRDFSGDPDYEKLKDL
jgi:HEAT repeat protein